MPDHRPRPLLELEPEWIVDNSGRVHGLKFNCPIHDVVPGNPDFRCTHHVGFSNPPDGGPKYAYWRISWDRRGDSFSTLVLAPSIRSLGFDDGSGCHWHGYVGGGAGE